MTHWFDGRTATTAPSDNAAQMHYDTVTAFIKAHGVDAHGNQQQLPQGVSPYGGRLDVRQQNCAGPRILG